MIEANKITPQMEKNQMLRNLAYRKFAQTAHITASGGWRGAAVGLGILVLNTAVALSVYKPWSWAPYLATDSLKKPCV